MDMLLSVIVCGLATRAAFALYSVDISVVVVVALVGFIGSAAIAGILLQGARVMDTFLNAASGVLVIGRRRG